MISHVFVCLCLPWFVMSIDMKKYDMTVYYDLKLFHPFFPFVLGLSWVERPWQHQAISTTWTLSNQASLPIRPSILIIPYPTTFRKIPIRFQFPTLDFVWFCNLRLCSGAFWLAKWIKSTYPSPVGFDIHSLPFTVRVFQAFHLGRNLYMNCSNGNFSAISQKV